MKKEWDEELPKSLQVEFQKWMKQLPMLKNSLSDAASYYQKEVRYDSSNVGLGMNYYVVSEDLDGKPYSELVLQGKSITIKVGIYHTLRRISSCSVKH